MADNTTARLPIARTAILVLLIGLAFRFAQVGLGDAPIVEAARLSAPTAPQAPARTLLRIDWLGQCPNPSAALGIYAPGDALCQPRQMISLNWLQGQLINPSLLVAGEYLELLPHPGKAECGALVLSGPRSVRAGWLCADALGLYRLDAAEHDSGHRWQIWSDGEWALIK